MGQTITDTILSAIDYAIDRKLQNLSYDQTFMSVVQSVNDDGTYTILDQSGCERDVKCLTAIEELSVGDNIFVTLPSGSLRNAYISGVEEIVPVAYDQTYVATITSADTSTWPYSYSATDSNGTTYSSVLTWNPDFYMESGASVYITLPCGDSSSAYISGFISGTYGLVSAETTYSC